VLVENVETFKHLLPRAEEGAILLQVPGSGDRQSGIVALNLTNYLTYLTAKERTW
jgi:hypothetical protein